MDTSAGIANLFNDEEFSLQLVDRLPNGIKRLHICMFGLSFLICPRTAIVLEAKWTGFKSDKCIEKSSFEINGQHDPESITNYAKGRVLLMCIHGVLDLYPHLCADAPRATRAIQVTSYREEGVDLPRIVTLSRSAQK